MAYPELTPAQRELIRDLPFRFPPERIDMLWLFPPHLGKNRESGLLVLSLLPHQGDTDNHERRVLFTVRYEATQVKGRLQRVDRTTEEGLAPRDGIERVIAGVISRSNADEPEPMVEGIEGRPERWEQLLERLGLAA